MRGTFFLSFLFVFICAPGEDGGEHMHQVKCVKKKSGGGAW